MIIALCAEQNVKLYNSNGMTKEEYDYRVMQELDKLLARMCIKECSNPQCRYENNSSNNYCVKCGWLLPGRSKQIMLNSNEYDKLIKRANLSVWGKIKECFSR